MLRRCVLEFSSIAKTRRLLRTQTPILVSSRHGFSSGVKTPQATPAVGHKTASTGSLIPKVLLGAIVVGAAVLVADETGYLDLGLRQSKTQTNVDDVQSVKDVEKVLVIPDVEPSVVASHHIEENINKNDDAHYVENAELIKSDVRETPLQEEPSIDKETQAAGVHSDLPKENTQSSDNEKTSEDVMQLKASSEQNDSGTPSKIKIELNLIDEGVEPKEVSKVREGTSSKIEIGLSPIDEGAEPKEVSKVLLGHETEALSSLLGSYSLQDETRPEVTSRKEPTLPSWHISPENEALDVMSTGSMDEDKSENVKIVLDVIQAIHIAEKRQAESDFHVFQEEKRRLKEEYEKELIDARLRELKLVGEADMLDNELNDERAKSVAAVKVVQDKAEQNLKMELQNKEEEMQNCIEKTKEMAKVELNSVVAQEKASQLGKIAEANLHVNALCMAFYARSEEALQTHSVYKLALGTLALEDALLKGLPVQTEVDMLRASLADIKSDTLVDLVLSSLPEETLNNGTDTKLQLNQKFDALKGTVRHFSFIPHGGGGILTHGVSYIASSIKIRENGLSGEGIESTISRVDRLLSEGKLSEAANTLESAVSGTEAEGAVQSWVKQARNRAIAEQALAVLQSYATSMSLN